MNQRSHRKLTTGVFPSYAPSGDRLVYCVVSSMTDEQDLWIREKDGSDKRLTNRGQTRVWPSWSPDGKWILFNSFNQNWNVYLREVKSGVTKPLTRGNLSMEKTIWSPNGKRIAYWNLRTDQIVIANLQGKTTSKIAGAGQGMPKLGDFAPNGSKIVYSKLFDGGLFVHDCSTNKSIEICRMDGYVSTPSYSPDGKWIAFQFNKTSTRRNRGRWDVFVVPSSGGKPVCLTSGLDGHSIAPCWRPRSEKPATSK